MSDVLTAAVAWRAARIRACEAPMGDRSVWQALGNAESALSLAVRDHVDAAAPLQPGDVVVAGEVRHEPPLQREEARAVVKGACRAVNASELAQPVAPIGGVLRDLAKAIDEMHAEIEGKGHGH